MDLRGRLKQEGVLDLVNRWQQKWKQRLEEMSSGRVMKIVYDGGVPGKHPQGKPRMKWSNVHTFALSSSHLLYCAIHKQYRMVNLRNWAKPYIGRDGTVQTLLQLLLPTTRTKVQVGED